MFSSLKLYTGMAVLLGLAPPWMAAQDQDHPATKPQTDPAMTAQEKKNLQFVLDFWREVIVARHVDLAEKYQAEDYIQHNPNVPTGRAAFVKFFGARPPQPIPDKLPTPPVVTFAKADYVGLIWEREDKEPADPSKTYRYNTLDVLRLQNGKIQEHWDSAFRDPSAQPAANSATVPAQKVVGAQTAEDKKKLAAAMAEFKDMLQYGHLELAEKYMMPTYIQHNPNVPGGRDGFVKFMSRNRRPEPIKEEWKNPPTLTIVAGPYVMFMRDTKTKDPADPAKEYIRDHFDIVRIENGKIAEHWDEARKNPPAP